MQCIRVDAQREAQPLKGKETCLTHSTLVNQNDPLQQRFYSLPKMLANLPLFLENCIP